MTNRSLIPLILVLTTIVILTVILTNTGTVRREIARKHQADLPKPADRMPIRLQPDNSLNRYLIESKPVNPAERLALDKMTMNASAAMHLENYEAAIDFASTTLVFDPQNYTALSVLGKSLFVTNRFKEAEAVYMRQAFFYKKDPVVLSNLGYTYAQLRNYKAALEMLQNALRYDSESGQILLSMAGIYALDKQKNEALEYFYLASLKLGTKLLDAIDEPMFDNIREEPDFKNITKALEARSLQK